MKSVSWKIWAIMMVLSVLFFVWAIREMENTNIYCVTTAKTGGEEIGKDCGTIRELKIKHPELWKKQEIVIDIPDFSAMNFSNSSLK